MYNATLGRFEALNAATISENLISSKFSEYPRWRPTWKNDFDKKKTLCPRRDSNPDRQI